MPYTELDLSDTLELVGATLVSGELVPDGTGSWTVIFDQVAIEAGKSYRFQFDYTKTSGLTGNNSLESVDEADIPNSFLSDNFILAAAELLPAGANGSTGQWEREIGTGVEEFDLATGDSPPELRVIIYFRYVKITGARWEEVVAEPEALTFTGARERTGVAVASLAVTVDAPSVTEVPIMVMAQSVPAQTMSGGQPV